MKPAIVDAISTVFDPEIPVNIYELGLIYEINVDADSRVGVRMTLTSPACPSAQQLPSEVRYKVKALDGVADCNVEIVWEPPWTKDMMSETAKLSLGTSLVTSSTRALRNHSASWETPARLARRASIRRSCRRTP